MPAIVARCRALFEPSQKTWSDILLRIVEVRFVALLVVVVGEQDARAGRVTALHAQLQRLVARAPVADVVQRQIAAVLRIRPQQAAARDRRLIAQRAGEHVRRQVVVERIRNVLRELRLVGVAEVRIRQVQLRSLCGTFRPMFMNQVASTLNWPGISRMIVKLMRSLICAR